MIALALLASIAVAFVGAALFERYEERRAERLERLNRESWELYRASRRIHDETSKALQALFEQARSSTRTQPPLGGSDR